MCSSNRPAALPGRRLIHSPSRTGVLSPFTDHVTRALMASRPTNGGNSAEHVMTRVTSRRDVTTSGCMLGERGSGTTVTVRFLFATNTPP